MIGATRLKAEVQVGGATVFIMNVVPCHVNIVTPVVGSVMLREQLWPGRITVPVPDGPTVRFRGQK